MFGRTSATLVALTLGTSLGLVVVDGASAGPKPPKPAISKLSPASGPATGGTTVKIKGKHLATTKKVLFDGVKGSSLKVKNDHKLTVVAPAHAAGAVDVKVKSKGGASKAATFTYLAVPAISKLYPSSGTAGGGTSVVISGTGFVAGATVSFGGTPATGVSVTSPTSITVTAPAHAAGAVPVVVSEGGRTSPGSAYTYLAPPTAVLASVPGADQTVTSFVRDLSCWAPGSCLAVGGYSTQVTGFAPLVEKLAGGTWTPSEPTLPAGGTPIPNAELSSISCVSATFCAVVGFYRTTGAFGVPVVGTWDGAAWTLSSLALPGDASTSVGAQFRAIDCVSATECRAVGYYTNTSAKTRPLFVSWATGSWNLTSPTILPGSDGEGLSAIDCTAPGECQATGNDFQVGGGFRPYVLRFVGGVLSSTLVNMPGDALTGASASGSFNSISCPAVGNCTAVGSYGSTTGTRPLVARLAAGVWNGSAVALPADATSVAQSYLSGVSCSSAISCEVAGTYATPGAPGSSRLMTGTTTPNSASVTAVPSPPTATATPGFSGTNLVCTAAGRCVTGGRVATASGTTAYVTRESGGVWQPAESLLLVPGTTQCDISGLRTDSAGSAAGYGTGYVAGIQHALLYTGVTVGP